MKKLLLVLLFIFASSIAIAQDNKVKISLYHSGEDIIGKRLAFSIREVIRSSSGYRLVPTNEAGMEIRLTSLDPDTTNQKTGNWTVAAVAIVMTNFFPYEKGNPQTWYPIYMTSVLMTVGTQRVEEQAKSILATVDEELEKYRTAARSR